MTDKLQMANELTQGIGELVAGYVSNGRGVGLADLLVALGNASAITFTDIEDDKLFEEMLGEWVARIVRQRAEFLKRKNPPTS